jgi:hypothetical protein
MLATEQFLSRGPSPATTTMVVPTAVPGRITPPTPVSNTMKLIEEEVALSKELAMRQFLRSQSYRSPVFPASPVMASHLPTAANPLLGYHSSMVSASTAAGSVSSAALLDHYSRVIRSRALARSYYELERNASAASVAVAGFSGRNLPIKCKPLMSKHRLVPRPLSKTSASARGGVRPLGPPPALPKATPGQKVGIFRMN